jgi:hypothetical protein
MRSTYLAAPLLIFYGCLMQDAQAATVTVYDLAGSWKAKATTVTAINNIVRVSATTQLICTISATSTSDGNYACIDSQGAPVLSGNLHLIGNGKRMSWSIDGQTIGTFENGGKARLSIWAESKGKVLDSNRVGFSVSSITTNIMKISQHSTASGQLIIGAPSKGKLRLKGKISGSVDNKPITRAFTFNTSLWLKSRY